MNQNEKNTVWQNMTITRELREQSMNQKACTIWLTGLSGSGKSTIANALEQKLYEMGKHTITLDGDNVRMGLNRNLGFSKEDRIENIRRIAEVSKLMNDAGVIAITSFISPYEAERENARKIVGERFLEVYVNTPLEICEKRDVKGLYAKARRGEIQNFTGISSEYEVPVNPEVIVETEHKTVEESVQSVIEQILPFINQ